MRASKGLSWLTDLPIAHRGFHDAGDRRPENSMSAFASAINAPYAIECDLQPSADGVPMVFHDDDLERLTGQSGNIRDLAVNELERLSLAGTEERIPTLRQLLALTEGKVPLILELKSQPDRDGNFAAAVCNDLNDYTGPVAVMSFEPQLMLDARIHAPGLPRGLVAEGGWRTAPRLVGDVIRTSAHFVSYAVDDLPTPAPLFARYCLGLPLICWTVRTESQRRLAQRWTDQITFEGFGP